MRALRGLIQGTKVTAFLVLSLGVSSILTISDSRPASAESPSLLGTVRCLVRTVLLTDCPKLGTPAPVVTPQPIAPSSPSKAPAQPANQTPSQPAPSRTNGTTPRGSQTTVAPEADEVTMPDTTLKEYDEVKKPVTEPGAYATDIKNAENLAYFNNYSPYAVAGAKTEAAASLPVQRTSEGWRIFGIAWYWWGIVILLVVTILFSVRRKILRKTSVLPSST